MKRKVCARCRVNKLLEEFSSHGNGRKESRCKDCINLAKQKYRKKYPWVVTFDSIKQRCNNKNNKRYKDWGGRGIRCKITVKELELIWFRDSAFKMKAPSIDRENNDGNYCLSNCRFIESGKNSAKDKCKPINQLNLSGDFIKSWKSTVEVERALGFNQGNISTCCQGKRKTANGFKWSFKRKR